MKKLIGLGIALLCLTSCSNDDDSPDINLDQIAKRWYNVSYVVAGKTVPYDGHENCGKDYLEMTAEGVAKEVDIFDCQQEPSTANGTYTTADKTLTITLNGIPKVYTIKKLNSKSLEIEASGNPKITYIYTSTP